MCLIIGFCKLKHKKNIPELSEVPNFLVFVQHLETLTIIFIYHPPLLRKNSFIKCQPEQQQLPQKLAQLSRSQTGAAATKSNERQVFEEEKNKQKQQSN